MSYILDALKKSEQERGHGHIPSVQTVHTSSLNYSNKKTYWPYILIAAVVLNLAAIIYFYLNKNETPAATTVSTDINRVSDRESVPSESNATVPVVTPASHDNTTNSTRQSITAPAVIAPAANTGLTRQAPAPPTSITDSETTDSYSTQNDSAETRDAGSANTGSNDTEVTSTEVIDTEIIDFYDLPESTKRRLPSIVVSAHVYSDNPVQRSIVINNNFLEEGERILDDLILQEITPGGAIMNYRGIVFRYEVISGWQ
jgi:general secretion pathway protein B